MVWEVLGSYPPEEMCSRVFDRLMDMMAKIGQVLSNPSWPVQTRCNWGFSGYLVSKNK